MIVFGGLVVTMVEEVYLQLVVRPKKIFSDNISYDGDMSFGVRALFPIGFLRIDWS